MEDDSIFIKLGPAGIGEMTYSEERALYEDYLSEDMFLMDVNVERYVRVAWDEKGRDRLSQIFIWHSLYQINSIQFQYADPTNASRPVVSDRHGTANGTNFDVVKLNFPTEYITWIGCHTDRVDEMLCSVTFGTNCGQYGPFGRRSNLGQKFNFRLGEENQFGGFYGAVNGKMVTAIGVYLKPAAAATDGVPSNNMEELALGIYEY